LAAALEVPLLDPPAVARAAVDALQVLVMSDLELCFWPPPPASAADARAALRRLRPCSRRRALVAARTALQSAADAAASAEEACCLRAALAVAQRETDAFCSAPPTQPAAGGDMPLLTGAEGGGVWAHPSLRSRPLLDRGSGLVAAAGPIGAGEDVLRVPESALLNVFSALQSPTFGPAGRGLLAAGVHAEAVTMLFAIAEKRRRAAMAAGEAAAMAAEAPWLELLARAPPLEEATQLAAWPREAVEALGSEEIAGAVATSVASLWDLCRSAKDAVAALPEAAREALGGPVGFDDLLWARCLFDGRAVEVDLEAPPGLRAEAGEAPPNGEEGPAQQWVLLGGGVAPQQARVACPRRVVCLAPVVDLLNHSANGACAPPHFCPQRRALVLASIARVATGAELCLSYGALQSWELLMYYGFCPRENLHDRLTLSLSPPDAGPSAAVREVLANLHGVPSEHALRPAAAAAEEVAAGEGEGWDRLGIAPPQLLRCLRLFLAEDPERVDLSAAPGAACVLELDCQCLSAMEALLQGMAEPFGPLQAPLPLWYPLHGAAVEAFRASQRALVAANEGAVARLRERLT
ncbi:unnamed protein product, partial [Prorocentrum cordatum]